MENKILQPKSGKLSLHENVELPIDGMPEFVQQYIKEIVRVYHCPIEFPPLPCSVLLPLPSASV